VELNLETKSESIIKLISKTDLYNNLGNYL